MEYTQVNVDQQIDMCRGRLAGYEADHYGHTINLLALEALPAEDAGRESAIRNEQRALSTLEASASAVSREMARLEAQTKKGAKDK